MLNNKLHGTTSDPSSLISDCKQFRMNWSVVWQSDHHLLTVFHWCIPFIGCHQNFSRSVCWPTQLFMKNNLFIFTPCLPHHSHPILCDQTKESLYPSLGSRPTQAGVRAFHSCALSVGTTARYLSAQPPEYSLLIVEMSQNMSFWLCLSPIDARMPNGPLMFWNCFSDCAFEHWFSYRATEPGYAGDIGAIEI